MVGYSPSQITRRNFSGSVLPSVENMSTWLKRSRPMASRSSLYSSVSMKMCIRDSLWARLMELEEDGLRVLGSDDPVNRVGVVSVDLSLIHI